ncbi:MAG: fumarylacetoacetate hydrolase family protein [Acidimicrobiales bacterium]
MIDPIRARADWEAELALVVGSRARHAGPEEARRALAGYSVLNDITARDWQGRSSQYLQGKTFESTTPLGPWLVTTDDPDASSGHWPISCDVAGERMQDADTEDLLFGPVDIVSYCSEILTLEPGDVIATGTPAGVGYRRQPPRYLAEGDEVLTRIDGIGELRNRCRAEGPSPASPAS